MDKFQERNLDTGNIFLFGEIDDENSQMVIEQLLYLDSKKRGRPKVIKLWINSPGGLLQPAYAMADLFDKLKSDVSTIGVGTVESAATFVLMAGTKGKRLISKYASVMLHEYFWSNSGSFTEMKGRQKEIENTRARQMEFIVERTGRTHAQAAKLLKHEEVWLSANEALKNGLVDGIY